MPQKQDAIKPFFLDLDKDYSELLPNQSPYLRSTQWDINGNPTNTGAGTNNPTGEGQNLLAISTTRSNEIVPNVELPTTGWNRNIGSFESPTTNEMYQMTYNSLGQHTIAVLDGNTNVWTKVITDPELQFSDDPEAFMANHRCTLRFVRDKNGIITEKYLLITDGQSWHKWINVIASIRTNGFDASLFPYWSLQPPHFDRRELLEWAVRPPMIKPTVRAIDNTVADTGKIGQLADKAFQFALQNINTDGRQSSLGVYSLPLIVKSTDYQNNPDNIPKNAIVKFPAGSPLTEKVVVWARRAEYDKNTFSNGSILEWGDWYIYETVNKYTSSGTNAPDVIGNDYWKRTNPFAAYNYDPIFNTFEYPFDNSRLPAIGDQDFANRIQTGMPQLSFAMTDLGDSVLLGDNRYDYPNFADHVKNSIDIQVPEKTVEGCQLPLRDIYLYAYVGRCGDEFSYLSQVGFYMGDDKLVRFGGLTFNDLLINDSINLGLNFADKSAFQVYLKGTPYSAVGEWYYVTTNNTLVKLEKLFDFSLKSEKDAAQTLLSNGNYFVCRFKLTVPAGRYIATIGRHNVSLSSDYRATSTYIYGIANSRIKSTDGQYVSIKPNAINSNNGILYSKEMELDCTTGNLDVWGNNADLFYIYCPYETRNGNKAYRFIEGYLRESVNTIIPVELFQYQMTRAATDDWGKFTDKNGHYWAYTKVRNAGLVDIEFYPVINCSSTHFIVQTAQGGIGWRENPPTYLENYTGTGVIGGCNRVVYKGKITNLAGTINYSNIAISIKDGSTALTKLDGTFTLIVHNGYSTPRISNVYINAPGNFIITGTGCSPLPLFNYNDSLIPCINCNVRNYPIDLNVGIKIDYISQTSLKEGAKYSIGLYGADLAGRVMYVNEIKDVLVPSFLKRNNTNATFFRMIINSALQLNKYPDMKWLIVSVSKNLTQKRYLDWVGDAINYIDANGNVVTDAASAVFVSISITSLYNYNVSNNFSVLANYQFVQGDRLRILDNGDNQLFDTATYGSEIDMEIYGTNFNQALINAGLTPPPTNTVLTTTVASQAQAKAVNLIVQYDPRLDKLIGKSGFWIETYTTTKEKDIIPYMDANGAYPIINGEIAEYTGGGILAPAYNYPTSIDIDFWDTYFFQRSINIPSIGSKFFAHIFQSPNITDTFGKEVTSGGRRWIKNDNAKQVWFGADTIKSDDFVLEGFVNGLATFRQENRRNFSTYPFGDIVAMKSARNLIAIICQNDYFLVDYNYHYVYPNAQGIMITNLNEGLSTPHQKVKGIYGLQKEDVGAFIVSEDGLFWLDNKNTAFVKMDYRIAVDISQLQEEYGEKGGIQSYLNTKLQFINQWNNNHPKSQRFDTVCGIDQERGNVYLTFRNRRKNTNNTDSYVNRLRDVELKASETIVYSIQYHAWLRFEGFVPEGYCRLRGLDANVEMYTFAAGIPYAHNNTPNDSYCRFYGQPTSAVIKGVFNGEKAVVKLYQSMAHDSNPNGWFIDLMYTNFVNSFSYLSANQFRKKETQWYAAIQRNMNAYPSNNPQDLFRSMLVDGYRIFGRYLVFRMVINHTTFDKYTQLNNIYILEAPSGNNQK